MTHCHVTLRTASLVLALCAAPGAFAASVDLAPSKDNTLYEDGTGGLSNGAGAYFFVGQAGSIRRAVLAFDVAASIPSGAIIQNVTLFLQCSRLPFSNPPAIPIDLHRLLASWGEGTSDAGDPGGSGASATVGDATWIHRFFASTLWTNPGGDFTPVVSGSFACGGLGSYSVGSTIQMVADVQGWLVTPSSNNGWLLQGPEGSASSNARRFDSRQNPNTAVRPRLHIEYTTGSVSVGTPTWSVLKGLFR